MSENVLEPGIIPDEELGIPGDPEQLPEGDADNYVDFTDEEDEL